LTPEQASLVRKAQDSLRAARLLAGGRLHSFAASRAYYAMFYIAEAFLLGDGIAYSKHSAVIAAFGQRYAKTGRVPEEYHRYLIEGQESRNVGDYDTGLEVSKKQTAEQIARAEKFIRLAKRLITPSRSEKKKK